MAESLSAISGLASGIDYRQLVDAIIASERRPADAAQAQIDAATKRKTALKTWRDLLTTLDTTLGKLRDGSGLRTLLATTAGQTATGRALFTATAASTAQAGSYAIEVISLARAEKLGGSAVADPSVALGLSGNFSLNGATITVVAEDSLSAIRDKINAANAGPTATKVSASILTVSAGESRLILTSGVAGSAGIARAEGSGGVLAGLGLSGGGEVLVAGSDARFTIDGIELVRSTNAVSDAISGVTLNLEAEGPGIPGTLIVGRDAAAAQTAVQAFVDAYNAAAAFIKEQGTGGTTPPPLYGDSMLRQSRASLSRGLLGVIGGDVGNTLSGGVAGLSLSKTGQLSLDQTEFSAAYAGGFDDMLALFQNGAGSTDLDLTLTAALQLNTGTVDQKTTGLTDRILLLQERIERIEGRLERRRAVLLQQFSRMETALSALQNQSSFLASQSATFTQGSR